MSSDGPPGDVLGDVKVGVELKLAALWAATAFCYYGDFFRLMQPGNLASMLAGRTPLGPVTPGLLLGFAIFMSVPAVMVFLSPALPAWVSRWANVILGAAYTLAILATMPGAWSFYLYLAAAEALLTATIAWLAWTWPRSSRP
jgi:Family of unknown function (DUF6326)